MIIVRRKYESQQLNYFKGLYSRYGSIPENDAQAIQLRMEFFREYVLRRVGRPLSASLPATTGPMSRRTGPTTPSK